jgi:hypothetical protein
MPGSEKQFENKIKQFLGRKGCYYVKYFANSFTKSGIPDILACVNGYFVAIEVKAPNGKPSKLQLFNRDLIRKAGGISVILYPENFEDFKELVNNLLELDQDYNEWKIAQKQYEFDREK